MDDPRPAAGPVVLRFDGYLDIGRYPEFRAAFVNAPEVDIIVDLRDVEGVDSVFLSELLLFRRRRAPRRVLTVVTPGEHLARVFALAEMDKRVDVFTVLDEALEALERPTA